MSSYPVRSTRFDLNLPVTFDADGEKFQGHCVNVSESGILANFTKPVEPWIIGKLSAQAGEYLVSIRAKVARVEGGDVGMSFKIEGENDRLAVRILLDFAKRQSQPSDAWKSAR